MPEENDASGRGFREVPGLTHWAFTELMHSPAVFELEYLSDRAAAIVAGTFLENQLTVTLKSRFICDEAHSKEIKELFRENGALGTFGTKVKVAYTLGLFSDEGFHDLELIVKIRNRFAHELIATSFDEMSTKNRCLQLKVIERLVIDPARPETVYANPSGLVIDNAEAVLAVPRNKYLLAVNQYALAMAQNVRAPYF